MTETQQRTAAILIIGDEILSGRTQDANIAYMATQLNEHGIQINEVRIVKDIESHIIKAVNELRSENDFLFTTGGIGPTHDDITAQSISKALNLPHEVEPTADKLLTEFYIKLNLPYNAERRRMATMPRGAELIDNPISVAPAFKIYNVFVLAGVPKIMQAMLENALLLIEKSIAKRSISIKTNLGEGTIAKSLEIIQYNHARVTIGSYPNFDPARGLSVNLVASSIDYAQLEVVAQEIRQIILGLNGKILD